MSIATRATRYLGLSVLLAVLCALGPVLTGCGGGADLAEGEARMHVNPPDCIPGSGRCQ